MLISDQAKDLVKNCVEGGYGSQIVAKFKRENICQNQQLDT